MYEDGPPPRPLPLQAAGNRKKSRQRQHHQQQQQQQQPRQHQKPQQQQQQFVRFDPELDWSQEAERSQRGHTLRCERRQQRKQQKAELRKMAQDDERKKRGTFLALKRELNFDKVVNLHTTCSVFRVNIDLLFEESLVGVGYNNDFSRRLNHFQTGGFPYRDLSNTAKTLLLHVSNTPEFQDLLTPIIPPIERISSSEDSDERAFQHEFEEGFNNDIGEDNGNNVNRPPQDDNETERAAVDGQNANGNDDDSNHQLQAGAESAQAS